MQLAVTEKLVTEPLAAGRVDHIRAKARDPSNVAGVDGDPLPRPLHGVVGPVDGERAGFGNHRLHDDAGDLVLGRGGRRARTNQENQGQDANVTGDAYGSNHSEARICDLLDLFNPKLLGLRVTITAL